MSKQNKMILLAVVVLLGINLAIASLLLQEKKKGLETKLVNLETEKKVESRTEKLQQGFFEALHGTVLEIDQASGTLKVKSIQGEKPLTMDVTFGDETEIIKIVTRETIPMINNEEGGEDFEDMESEVETTKTNSSPTEILVGATVQVETGGFFKINQGETISAEKITLFEHTIIEEQAIN